jgi:GAF domain-containing protein
MSTDDLLRELAELSAASVGVLAPPAIDSLAESIVGVARGVFGAAACSLAVLDEQTDELVYVAAAGEGAENIVGVRLAIGRGIAGWVVQSGQPIAVSNLADDRRFARDVAESTGYVPSAMLAVPVESDEQVLGVLSVLDRDADRAGAAGDLELATSFAAQAAAALAARAAFADAGAVLLRGLADAAAQGGALADSLRANAASGGSLAEIAALLGELNRSGDAERRLALRILTDVLDYARR